MQTNKIILGTVQFGLEYGINNRSGRPSSEVVFKILDEAYHSGIVNLETAEAYGESQDLIGNYFLQNPNRKFKVLTKFKSLNGVTLKEQLCRTLAKLTINNVEAYSYHQFSELDNNLVSDQLKDLKKDGLIIKIGVSVYSNDELKKAASYDFIDIIQLPFNLFDNWTLRGELIQNARKNGKEIHVRSVFLQGLFYMDPSNLPDSLKGLEYSLASITEIAKNYNVSINALALQYALSFPEIDKVLIGVDSDHQFHANLIAMREFIPAEAFRDVSKIKIQYTSLIDPRTWK